jgi:hypothetical protein
LLAVVDDGRCLTVDRTLEQYGQLLGMITNQEATMNRRFLGTSALLLSVGLVASG